MGFGTPTLRLEFFGGPRDGEVIDTTVQQGTTFTFAVTPELGGWYWLDCESPKPRLVWKSR